MRALIPVFLFLFLAACAPADDDGSAGGPGTARVICADMVQEGQADGCDGMAFSAAPAAADPDGIYRTSADPVPRELPAMTTYLLEVVGGDVRLQAIRGWMAICSTLHASYGTGYSIISTTSTGTYEEGITEFGAGSNCPEGELGTPMTYFSYLYPGTVDFGSDIMAWTPEQSGPPVAGGEITVSLY
jgi:hypothetical protein